MGIYSTSQCRSLTNLYLFKIKTESSVILKESSVILKIYDVSQRCIAKTTFSFSQLEVPPNAYFSLTNPQLLKIVQKHNLIPVNKDSDPLIITLEDCLKEIEQVIKQVKSKVLFENEELEKFTCPITLCVFEEAVIDEHGHTFDKSAIETQLKIENKCPKNRQPIYSLTPNLDIQQFIEEIKRQDPIPTFALFKQENKQLASSNLKLAQDYINNEEYKNAVGAYAKAFQYTKDWRHYQQLPSLFELMKQKDKALLARFYLIQYQLQDKKVQDAIQIAEQCNDPQLILLLIKLYLSSQRITKASTFALEKGNIFAKAHPQEAILMFKQIINDDPYQFKAYPLLVSLTKASQERAHIFLTGACYAIQKKEYDLAYDFCTRAKSLYEDSFIDRLIDLDFLLKQRKPIKEELLNIANLYEKKNLLSFMIKAYRMLAQLDYDPFYYEKIITGYDQIQKPEKALQWTLRWLSLLIEKKEWKQAESISLQTLQKTQQTIPFYENLETIYTNWHGHELNNLWGKLGKAYSQDGQLIQAEKTYQKAFSQFNSFEHAVALADTLIKLDKKALGVQTYYQASSIALLKNRVEDLSLCVNSILKADPDMAHLELSQRMILLTQSRILELSNQFELLSREVKILNAANVPTIAFGKNAWFAYFGDIGIEPPLPPNIHQILAAQCPVWPKKKVHETHLLTLIPSTVNGISMTLKSLGEFVKKPLRGSATLYSSYNVNNYTDPPALTSHWVLMTRDVIPRSRGKSYTDQQKLAKGFGYAIPNILDATVSIFIEYVRSGNRMYNRSPSTYTHCQEKYNQQRQFIIGGFASMGLFLGSASNSESDEDVGVGIAQTF